MTAESLPLHKRWILIARLNAEQRGRMTRCKKIYYVCLLHIKNGRRESPSLLFHIDIETICVWTEDYCANEKQVITLEKSY